MDGVERAFGGANATADALIRVDDGGTATKAAGRFNLNLFLGECLTDIAEGLLWIVFVIEAFFLPCGIIVLLNEDIVFVEGDEFHLVNAFVLIGSRMGDAMQSIGGHFTGGDRVDNKLRTSIDVSADDD